MTSKLIMEHNCQNILIILSLICSVTDTKLVQNKKKPGLIYILLWTGRGYVPCAHWKLGKRSFTMMGCEYRNCFIVEDVNYFKDITEYDALVFNSIDLTIDTELPKARSDTQMYVFLSTESSMNYPTHFKYNWFFNYTWTYKMSSDISYPYIITRDKRGEVIAPKVDPKWMDIKDMKAASDSVIERLDNKSIAAAWFVTNCYASSPRINYLRSLRGALKKYNHEIDVFGVCEANKWCSRKVMDECFALVERDYYFYLSFENSFTEDYVTEKLLTALNHYAVPIVLGGANYSRFMPDGIYLNANNVTGEEMANKIVEAIANKEKYYEYFKWHEHYSYHTVTDSADTDPLCNFCAFLNNETNKKRRQVYARFTRWWNGFDEVLDAKGDIIVHYDAPKTLYKIVQESSRQYSVEVATPSAFQSLGDFMDSIFGYYFEG